MRTAALLAQLTHAGHLSFGGSVGSLVQLNFVYFFSVMHKKALGYQIWFVEGSATYWALASLPYYRTPIGEFFITMPRAVLKVRTTRDTVCSLLTRV